MYSEYQDGRIQTKLDTPLQFTIFGSSNLGTFAGGMEPPECVVDPSNACAHVTPPPLRHSRQHLTQTYNASFLAFLYFFLLSLDMARPTRSTTSKRWMRRAKYRPASQIEAHTDES